MKPVVRIYISMLAAARPGWVTLNEVSGSSLPLSVSGHITSFLPSIFMPYQPHSTAQHNVAKDNTENSDLKYIF